MKKTRINSMMNSLGKSFILFAVIFVTTTCQERLDEMNNNPNALTEVPASYLFTTAVRNSFSTNMNLLQATYGGQYSHLIVAGGFDRETDKYLDTHISGDMPESLFKSFYSGIIKYCNDIMSITANDGRNPNEVQNALANILAVMNFARLTDLFGDIPYFEGGQGKEGLFNPEYEKQEDIYADMVKRLKINLEILERADFSNAFPGTDPMYFNNKERWMRFTNSLRLRLAMRARFADPDTYNPIITECLSKNLIEDNDDNAKLDYIDSPDPALYNPWHFFYISRYEQRPPRENLNVSEKYVTHLKTTGDPRLEVMVAPNNNGEYVGMPNGLTDAYYADFSRKDASILSNLVLARDQSIYFMAASEIWFLRAEAALFGLSSETDANQLYQMGITRAMQQWNIPQEDIDIYLANSSEGALSGTHEEKFEQIGNQMWLAFVPNYVQAWFNIRRTGYPVIAQRTADSLSQGITNGYMPSRLQYPSTDEKTINGVNMQEAIDRMPEGDQIYSKVWWDIRD